MKDFIELFDKTDPAYFESIEEIYYFDEWSSYEEFGGLCIFKLKAKSCLLCIKFGYSVYVGSFGNDLSQSEAISQDRAIELMLEMDEAILECLNRMT